MSPSPPTEEKSSSASNRREKKSSKAGTSTSSVKLLVCPGIKLDEQNWYHGVIPLDHLKNELVDPGDWLVYASQTAKVSKWTVDIMLALHDGANKLVQFKLDYRKGVKHRPPSTTDCARPFRPIKMVHEGHWHNSIFDLIGYYHKHAVEVGCTPTILKAYISRPSWMIMNSQVKATTVLGAGQYATVKLGTLKRTGENGEDRGVVQVAIKEPRVNDELKDTRDEMLNEAMMMASYKHRNVVRFYGVAAEKPPIKIVLEFCGGGSLIEELRKRPVLADSRKWALLYQAACGMAYLSDIQHCIHGDLAARNCLLHEGILKVADFGLSCQLAENTTEIIDEAMTKCAQPIGWLAPELIRRKPLKSSQSDVYAFAIMMWEVYTDGDHPWKGLETKVVMKNVKSGKRPQIPATAPPAIREMMSKSWTHDPPSRPTFAKLQHTLFMKRDKTLNEESFYEDSTQSGRQPASRSQRSDPTARIVVPSESCFTDYLTSMPEMIVKPREPTTPPLAEHDSDAHADSSGKGARTAMLGPPPTAPPRPMPTEQRTMATAVPPTVKSSKVGWIRRHLGFRK